MSTLKCKLLVIPAIVLLGLVLGLSMPSNTFAADFSADLVLTGGPMSGQGKVYVKGQKMRQELGGQMGNIVTIMDLDGGYNYVIMPESKSYMKMKVETKGKGFNPENFMSMLQKDMPAELKKIGSEKVAGYGCEKYQITFENTQMGTMTLWFSEKLGFPLKVVGESAAVGKMVQELQNIKMESVNDSLFQLPAGYKEMAMPQMPQVPVKE